PTHLRRGVALLLLRDPAGLVGTLVTGLRVGGVARIHARAGARLLVFLPVVVLRIDGCTHENGTQCQGQAQSHRFLRALTGHVRKMRGFFRAADLTTRARLGGNAFFIGPRLRGVRAGGERQRSDSPRRPYPFGTSSGSMYYSTKP